MAKKVEYENIGGIKYDIKEADNVISLVTQYPFTIISGENKMIATGLKIKLPEDSIGMIVNDDEFVSKTAVGIFGSSIIDGESDIFVMVRNNSRVIKQIKQGQVIAKLVILEKYPLKKTTAAKKKTSEKN